MPLTFTELARYSFTRPNVDPLDPAVWATLVPGPGDGAPAEPLAVVSNQCVCPTSLSNANFGGAQFKGVVLPPDQYVEVVITQLKNGAFFGIGLRSDITSFIGYELSTNAGALGSPIPFSMSNTGPTGGPSGGDMADTIATLNPGDTLRFATIGGTFLAFINGKLILRTTETPLGYDSGTTYLEFQNLVANDDVQIASYAVGSVTGTDDAPIFTQVFSDPLNGANQNPLNTANWTAPGFYAPLQVRNHVAEATATADINDNFEFYTGQVLTKDQWCEVQITRLQNGGEFGLELRGDNNFDVYDFDVIDNGDGTVYCQLFVFVNNDNVSTAFTRPDLPFTNGDTFRVAVLGSTMYWYHNGVQFAQVDDVTLAAGKTGLFISTNAIGDVRMTNFKAGNVTSPVPPVTLPQRSPFGFEVDATGKWTWDYDANMASVATATGLSLLQRSPAGAESNGTGGFTYDYNLNMAAIAQHLSITLFQRGPYAFEIDATGKWSWDYDLNMAAIQAALA